jgi:hypothetical protein
MIGDDDNGLQVKFRWSSLEGLCRLLVLRYLAAETQSKEGEGQGIYPQE